MKLLFNFNNFNSRLPASTTLNILTPKRHILAWFRAFWAIMRQNRSKGLISARVSVTPNWLKN